jgi:hypothetical protein
MVGSAFDRLDRAAQRVQDAVFGTPNTLFRPYKPSNNVNAAPIIDPIRPSASVTVIFTEKDAKENLEEATDRHQDHRPGVSAHIQKIEVDVRQWNIDPARGDMFILPDGRRFRVTSVDPTDVGRVFCNLAFLG